MGVPSAYVDFLCTIMPGKPKAEIYTSVGCRSRARTCSIATCCTICRIRATASSSRRDQGLVMLVFTLPSFPYVFKIIKDQFPPPKETTRAQIMEKYQLVKRHDRLGRMADTLEYSSVALPLARLDRARARAGKGSAVAARIRGRQSRDRAPVHRAPDDAAQPVPAERLRCRRRARREGVRQRGEGADEGEHLPRRHAVQESASRATAAWCSTTTTRSST